MRIDAFSCFDLSPFYLDAEAAFSKALVPSSFLLLLVRHLLLLAWHLLLVAYELFSMKLHEPGLVMATTQKQPEAPEVRVSSF